MHLAKIDTRDDSFEVSQIDDFESPDGQPPRSIRIDKYEDEGVYLLNYLRPAKFSYRPEKGLTGSVAVNAVDIETNESIDMTVVAGHTDSEAVTHFIYGAKYDEQRLAIAYTTVDSVHQWHGSSPGPDEHANYVSSQLEIYKIKKEGKIEKEAQHVFEEPFWDVVLGVLEDKTIFLSYNSTTEANERWVEFYYYSPQ